MLELAGRTDIPVAAGADRPLRATLRTAAHVHGESGLDGPDLPEPTAKPVDAHAADLLAELLEPGVVLVPTGPLTNVALLLERHPDVRSARAHRLDGRRDRRGQHHAGGRVQRVRRSGGGGAVFASGITVTMIGLDITHKALFTRAHAERLRGTGRAGQLVAELSDFFQRFHESRYGFDGSPIHDALAVAEVIDPSLVTTLECNVEIETRLAVLRRPHGRRPLARHRPAAQRLAGVDVDADAFPRAARRAHLDALVIAFAAIAPHGDVESPPELHAAMQELGRRFDASGCETRDRRHPAQRARRRPLRRRHAAASGRTRPTGRSRASLRRSARTGLPVVGVSYGGNDPAEAEHPLDWGTEVPLEFVRARRIVVVAPARDRPLAEHIRLGEVIAAATGDRPVALIASADHGARPRRRRPVRLRRGGGAYDERFLALLGSEPLDFTPLGELVEAAKADSLWQLLVLQGAVAGGPSSSRTRPRRTTAWRSPTVV